MSSKLRAMFKDIGLDCAVHIKRGQLKTTANNIMPAHDDDNIALIDHYEFLGKFQNTQHLDDKTIEEAAEEYRKRMLSVPRKVKATNYALPTMQCYMWTTNWQINILRDLDRLTRKIIKECHGKHKHELTQLRYLPPEEGGKGLIEIEALYKHTKIKVAH